MISQLDAFLALVEVLQVGVLLRLEVLEELDVLYSELVVRLILSTVSFVVGLRCLRPLLSSLTLVAALRLVSDHSRSGLDIHNVLAEALKSELGPWLVLHFSCSVHWWMDAIGPSPLSDQSLRSVSRPHLLLTH